MVLFNANLRKAVTVSIIVLAYNEAGNLPKAIEVIHEAVIGRFADYEIIIVNDGSGDETGLIADDLAASGSRVVSVHNEKNMGCGYTFWHGVKTARFQYVWLIPGDGEIPQVSLYTIAGAIGSADMILPYMVNSSIRPLLRRVISWGYTSFVNVLFFKRIHYYNGPGVFTTAQVRTAPEVHSRGFAFMAPVILQLLKNGCTYRQVGIGLGLRQYGKPSFGTLWSIFSGFKAITGTWWSLNIIQCLQSRKKKGERRCKYAAHY